MNNYLALPEDEKMFTDGQKVKAREDSYAAESLASSETKNSSSRKRRKFLAEEKPDDENSLALPACLQRGSSPTIVKETQLFNSSNKKFIDQLTRTEKMGAQNNHTTKQQNSGVQIHLTSTILISNESFENVSKMIGI